ncbi:MAG TPA: TRAP transporter small permease [Smithellaceae bacterium]|nr:TRAP transporter small permease [Smithellaceae bacterium]
MTIRKIKIVIAGEKISRLLNYASVFILGGLMLLTITDVFLRKVLSRGILGTWEVSEYMMAFIVFFSLAEGELKKRNVNVDIMVKNLPAKARKITDAAIKLLGFILYCFITAGVFSYARLLHHSGEVSLDLWLPKHIFVYSAGGALVIFSVILLTRLIIAVREVRLLWTR